MRLKTEFFIIAAQQTGRGLAEDVFACDLLYGEWPHSDVLAKALDPENSFGGGFIEPPQDTHRRIAVYRD